MTSKTLTIRKEAYEALARYKRKGESFSDVILRLTRRAARLEDSFGTWPMTDEEYERLFGDIAERRCVGRRIHQSGILGSSIHSCRSSMNSSLVNPACFIIANSKPIFSSL